MRKTLSALFVLAALVTALPSFACDGNKDKQDGSAPHVCPTNSPEKSGCGCCCGCNEK